MVGGDHVAGLVLCSCDQWTETIIEVVGRVDNTGVIGPGRDYASA